MRKRSYIYCRDEEMVENICKITTIKTLYNISKVKIWINCL